MTENYTMEEIYVDQAVSSQQWPIICFFTPYGIKQRDSEYCRRIIAGSEDKFELQEEILADPHLHQMIKNNLLYNLFNR